MDLRTLVRILVKRWMVVVPTIALSVLVGWQMLSSVKVTYEAKASVALFPIGDENPLLAGSGPLQGAANVVVRQLANDTTRRALVSQGYGASYGVEVEDDAAIISIVAEADTEEEAVDTVDALIRQTDAVLANYQDLFQVPNGDRIVSNVLDTAENAQQLQAGRTRTKFAMVVLGTAATVSAALLAESWAQSRPRRERRRRVRAQQEQSSSAPLGNGAEPRVPVHAVGEGDRSGRPS